MSQSSRSTSGAFCRNQENIFFIDFLEHDLLIWYFRDILFLFTSPNIYKVIDKFGCKSDQKVVKITYFYGTYECVSFGIDFVDNSTNQNVNSETYHVRNEFIENIFRHHFRICLIQFFLI